MTGPRTRPARPALSREAVVAAALAVVDEVGFEAASMRRVAQALDTGAASLYVYVADRRELMALAHDLALADVVVPSEADGDWRTRVELLLSRRILALARHSDIAMVAIADVPVGPHSLRLDEQVLALLRAGGIDEPTCAWAADLLGQFVASSALEDAAWRHTQRLVDDPDAGSEAMSAAFSARLDAVYAALPADDFPTIHALRPWLTRGGGDARAAWKLRVLVDGLLARG